MIHVAVCDDDINVLEELSLCVKKSFEKLEFPIFLQSFDQPADLLRQYRNKDFDVLFLDIDMPGIDGVAFGRYLRSQNLLPCIVYISCREDRVFETFSIAPLRFIRKNRLFEEIDESALAIIQWWSAREQRKMVIASRDEVVSIDIDNIVYVECLAKVQSIVTLNETHAVKLTMREVECKLLPFGFVQPHKGFIVNFRHIDRITTRSLLLKDGTVLPISKRRIADTKKAFLQLTTKALNIRAPRSTDGF